MLPTFPVTAPLTVVIPRWILWRPSHTGFFVCHRIISNRMRQGLLLYSHCMWWHKVTDSLGDLFQVIRLVSGRSGIWTQAAREYIFSTTTAVASYILETWNMPLFIFVSLASFTTHSWCSVNICWMNEWIKWTNAYWIQLGSLHENSCLYKIKWLYYHFFWELQLMFLEAVLCAHWEF